MSENKKKPDKKKKIKKKIPNDDGVITGQFSGSEEQFIKDNFEKMTDKELAKALNRDHKSVTNKRRNMGLAAPKRTTRVTQNHRIAYVGNLDDQEKKDFFEKEVRNSSGYKQLMFGLEVYELDFFVDKWVDFMMDPTIETMTAAEKDTLHNMIIAEIKINQYLKIEKIARDNAPEGSIPISKAKEIREMQEVILKCQSNLNVERKQRLKDQNDQAVTFTNVIKDFKNPSIRVRAGNEAAMLKYIGEASYNQLMNKKTFTSGRSQKFDLNKNFKDNRMENLPGNFLPTASEGVEEITKGD